MTANHSSPVGPPLLTEGRASALELIKVAIDMHDGGSGRFIARIKQDCACGQWGITITLAEWSHLGSISESAYRHLGEAHATAVR